MGAAEDGSGGIFSQNLFDFCVAPSAFGCELVNHELLLLQSLVYFELSYALRSSRSIRIISGSN